MVEHENEITRLIAEEDFAGLPERLAKYAAAVPQDSHSLLSATDYLRAAILAVRTRRAHMKSMHADLSATNRYVHPGGQSVPQLDLMG